MNLRLRRISIGVVILLLAGLQANVPGAWGERSHNEHARRVAHAKMWKGAIELRGLEPRKYLVVDYVSGKDFGTLQGPSARLNAEFTSYLLVEAQPD